MVVCPPHDIVQGASSNNGGLRKAYSRALRLVHPDKLGPGLSHWERAKASRILDALQRRKPE